MHCCQEFAIEEARAALVLTFEIAESMSRLYSGVNLQIAATRRRL